MQTQITPGYEASPRAAIRKHLPDIDNARVLEVGAGIGGVTSELEKIADFVVACEPQPSPYKALVNNTEHALTLPLAVSTSDYPVSMLLQAEWYNTHVSKDVWAAKLPSVNIHRLVDVFEPNVLVMDCEGFEAELLNVVNLFDIEMVGVEVHPKKCDPALLTKAYNRLAEWGFVLVEEREAHPEPGLVYCIYRSVD